MVPFTIDSFAGTPGEFHAADLLADVRPRIIVAAATAPALVLGSSQDAAVADAAACTAAAVEVLRRRSGGGAVLVAPGEMVWFDVVVPADDPRFVAVADDVTASMTWLGGHVAAVLDRLGVADAVVHDGRLDGGEWGRLVCFAGRGPGELFVGGAKLVGISQRRRRAGARFQCMVHTRWDPERMISLLSPPRPTAADLPAVTTLPPSVAADLPAALAATLNH